MTTISPRQKAAWMTETLHEIGYVHVVGYAPISPISTATATICHELASVVHRYFGDWSIGWLLCPLVHDGSYKSLGSTRLVSLESLLNSKALLNINMSADSAVFETYRGPFRPNLGKPARAVWMVTYSHGGPGIPMERHPDQPTFEVRVRTSLCRTLASEKLLEFIRDCVFVLDNEAKCFQGLVDVALAHETCGGHYYSSLRQEQNPWNRDVDHTQWIIDAAGRHERIRGAYWGLWLGKYLANKLDFDGTFINRFNSEWHGKVVQQHLAERLPNGGIYCRMSNKPLELVEDIANVGTLGAKVAVWFVNECRKRGMW